MVLEVLPEADHGQIVGEDNCKHAGNVDLGIALSTLYNLLFPLSDSAIGHLFEHLNHMLQPILVEGVGACLSLLAPFLIARHEQEGTAEER